MKHVTLILFIVCGNNFIAKTGESLDAERIIGGNMAEKNQFTYRVSIQIYGFHVCGGGIIHPSFVITAAHCLINSQVNKSFKDIVTIVASPIDLYNENESAVAIQVVEIYVPKSLYLVKANECNSHVSNGDIAMLKLAEKLDLSPNSNISKLELPLKHSSHLHRTAVIAGHGYYTSDMQLDLRTGEIQNLGMFDGKLRYATVKVLSLYQSKKLCRELRLSDHILGEIMEMDQRKPRGICTGDSGSPLVYDNVIIGIASFAHRSCDERIAPTAYTRITHYLSFINHVLKDRTSNIRIIKWETSWIKNKK